ncbi:MAG: class I SAM-dependent methyltransferase [Planctomycetota bacterium]
MRDLRAACEAAGNAFPPLSGDAFDAAHEAYEHASGQRQGILKHLAAVLDIVLTAAGRADRPLRVLSVGPGNGMLDLELIASLGREEVRAEYVGVDPSPVACRRFREGFAALEPAGVSLAVHQCSVDELPASTGAGLRFDVIHAVHSLYYVPDPPATLRLLLGMLAPGGRLALYKAPRGDLNTLAEPFWRGDPNASIWFSDRLSTWLREERVDARSERIDAQLDVTDVFDPGSQAGRLVLDFLLHTKADQLGDDLRRQALECLDAMCIERDGRRLAPHPVDAFCVASI